MAAGRSCTPCHYPIPEPWHIGCGLRIADCGLRIADCGLRIADCGLRIADCGLRIADGTVLIAQCPFSLRGY